MQESGEPGDVREEFGSNVLFSFDGRIDTGTFWRIALLNFVGVILGGIAMATAMPPSTGLGSGYWVSRAVVYGVGFWLSMATQVKRWHDLDKSGWMALLNLIPGINVIVFLYLGFKQGTPGPNQYGDGPMKIKLL